ncbi:hypothetical protein V6N12_062209 [Hibiscus sabdariffa]|uniref:Uncharacterized protein n=1 Tax=Hibiscus sabdariffa TaxID=183260 RepID=A0ABR2F889_9ROSI
MFTNAENVSLSNADNLSIHLNVPDHEESDHTNTSHANATEDPGHASHANEERGYTTAIAREDLGQRDSAAVRSVHSEAGQSGSRYWAPSFGLGNIGSSPHSETQLSRLLGISDPTTVTAAQGRATADHTTAVMISGRRTMSNYVSCTHRLPKQRRWRRQRYKLERRSERLRLQNT